MIGVWHATFNYIRRISRIAEDGAAGTPSDILISGILDHKFCNLYEFFAGQSAGTISQLSRIRNVL